MRKYFFLSEKWGGYTESSPFHDKIQNPFVIKVILFLWFTSALMLIVGKFTLIALFYQWVMSRYFFIKMRWINLARGLGAPGFITYWLSTAFFLIEFSIYFSPSSTNLILWVVQIDFACIILAAGYYKFKAGYPQNSGMELGMINPEWGYWINFFKKFSPHNIIFKAFNQLAWSTEIIAGVLMLIPQTRFYGGLLLMFIFLFILTQLRLGFLCEMVVCICFLYFCKEHPLESYLEAVFTLPQPLPVFEAPLIDSVVKGLLSLYIILLPFAYAGLCTNFYLKKKLYVPLQTCLDSYTNFFGMILWRVFSSDVTNFYINIYKKDSEGNKVQISNYAPFKSFRFNHVAECIAVTTIFSSLKYFSRESGIFNERLVRYSKTLSDTRDEVVYYEYVSIQKAESSFIEKTVSIFRCDPTSKVVEEDIIDHSFSVTSAAEHSPIHVSKKPGSYTPS